MSSVFKAITQAVDEYAAAEQLASNLLLQQGHSALGFVVFFCAADYDLPRLAKAMQQSFGDIPVVGCTSSGEISPQGYSEHSIVAIGFSSTEFQLASVCITELDQFDLLKAQQVVTQLKRQLHAVAGQASDDHTFDHECLVMTLLDGLSAQEELVLLALESALGPIAHFGGSAGDNHQLRRTHLYFQGQFYSNAAVLLMVRTHLPFAVFSTSHLQHGAEKLVVTAASVQSRVVYELNAEPAAQAYADLLGLTVAELNPTVFALHPLAVRIGQEYYIRAIQKVNADLSLTFYCAMANGMVLTAMKPDDLIFNLAEQLQNLSSQLGEPLLTIGCDCVLRKLEVDQLQLAKPAQALFARFNVVGFNTYGEHFNGVHLNQTFTGVMFAKAKTW